MTTFLQRLVAAYRPLYQRGLLLDGRRGLPMTDKPLAAERPAPQAAPPAPATTPMLTTFHPRSPG